MRPILLALSLLAATTLRAADPVFTHFDYEGCDSVYILNPLSESEFYNPILQGYYPDPSIVRRGEDYYLVNSSFAYWPGVPIFHSTDLVNWRQLGSVLTRPSQLDVAGIGMSDGIYAPDIVYNPHNETFYMITTCVGGARAGNFFVKAADPAGPWSDPIALPQVRGIDPALFFDDDGRGYIVHNDLPDGPQLYGSTHRAIRLWHFDPATDRITGGGRMIVDGGTDIALRPSWIEGPHIYKHEGAYFLMCAQGGTGPRHSEVIFRAENIEGPYIPAPGNPILSQRWLDGARKFPVTAAGHADLVQTPQGDWYGLFLAIRPYDVRGEGLYNTGRETFMLPVDWSGTWPVFENGLVPIAPKLPLPAGVQNKTGREGFMPNGNFVYHEAFTGPALDARWLSVRGPVDDFVAVGDGLRLGSAPVNLRERATPAMVAYRQQHASFRASTTMRYTPAQGRLAGLACFQNEGFNYVLGATLVDGKPCVVLEKTARGEVEIVAVEPIAPYGELSLRVEAAGRDYRFAFAVDGGAWRPMGGVQDGAILSTDVAGGFTGCVIGLYATSKR